MAARTIHLVGPHAHYDAGRRRLRKAGRRNRTARVCRDIHRIGNLAARGAGRRQRIRNLRRTVEWKMRDRVTSRRFSRRTTRNDRIAQQRLRGVVAPE